MKYIIALICFFVSILNINAESFYSIEGKVLNAENIKSAYLYSYQKGNYKLIDTTLIQDDKFSFQLEPSAKRGIYRIRFSPFLTIENIIFNFENIKLTVDLKKIATSLNYELSDENKVFNSYLQFLNHEVNREKAFLYLLGFYPQEELFYSQINTEMKRLKAYNRDIIQSLIKDNSHLLASKYIKYDQLPYYEIKGNSATDIEHLIVHFWDNIDFSDTMLLNFPLFVDKLDNFFSLFEDQTLSRYDQETAFQVPADILLEKSSSYPKINEFIVEKILNDAIQFNLHDLYAHVAQKIYENDYCINADKMREVNKKLIDISKVAVGKTASNFKITDNLDLNSIKSEYTLIVFWESDCNYCNKKLNELKKIYKENNNKRFEIVAISLDTEPLVFQRSLLERNYKWINISDFKGWYSPIVNDYCISSTPAMFLLDKHKHIIAKPVKIEHILHFIDN